MKGLSFPPPITLNELSHLLFLDYLAVKRGSAGRGRWLGMGPREGASQLASSKSLPFHSYPQGSIGQRQSNLCCGEKKWGLSSIEIRLRFFFHCANVHNPRHSLSPSHSLNQRQKLDVVPLAILESSREGVITVIRCISSTQQIFFT